LQVSFVLHASPSQSLAVQTLSSSQSRPEVGVHVPDSQWSPVLQTLPSSHTVLSGRIEMEQPELGSHDSGEVSRVVESLRVAPT